MFQRKRYNKAAAEKAKAEITGALPHECQHQSVQSKEQGSISQPKQYHSKLSNKRLQHVKDFFDAVRAIPLSEEAVDGKENGVAQPEPAVPQKGASADERSASVDTMPLQPLEQNVQAGTDHALESMLMPELPPLDEHDGMSDSTDDADADDTYAAASPQAVNAVADTKASDFYHARDSDMDHHSQKDGTDFQETARSRMADQTDAESKEHAQQLHAANEQRLSLPQVKRRSSLGLSNRKSLSVVRDERVGHNEANRATQRRSSLLMNARRSSHAPCSQLEQRRSTVDEQANRNTANDVHGSETATVESQEHDPMYTQVEHVPNEAVPQLVEEADDEGGALNAAQLGEQCNRAPNENLDHSANGVSPRKNPELLSLSAEVAHASEKDAHLLDSPIDEACELTDPQDPLQALMIECGQDDNMLEEMDHLLSGLQLTDLKKIGEGTFGEAFLGSDQVLKVVPVAGDVLYNGASQKGAEEMHAEAIISNCLSALRHGDGYGNRTSGFIEMKQTAVCSGPYASSLVQAWEEWAKVNESLNDHPCGLPSENHYLIFVCANGGRALEESTIDDVDQGTSVLLQIALTLAVGERSVEFEHRDLHWGNALLKRCDNDATEAFELEGCTYDVPTYGVRTHLIDFTLSRLHAYGQRIYCNLADEEDMFAGERGYAQSETYRRMRETLGNEWSQFCPTTNALWLAYLTRKVIQKLKLPSGSRKRRAFERFASRCNNKHQSAYDAVHDPAFHDYAYIVSGVE